MEIVIGAFTLGTLAVGFCFGRFTAPEKIVTRRLVERETVYVDIEHHGCGRGGGGEVTISCSCGCPYLVPYHKTVEDRPDFYNSTVST